MEKTKKHLKPYLHYADLYDRYTVEHCRWIEKPLSEENRKPVEGKKISKKKLILVENAAKHMILHFQKGERYLNKEKTIREWMDADQAKDDLYENAQAPEDIRCLTCRNRLVPTYKQLWSIGEKGDRVLFMYDCPNKCMPRRAFFSDGEEWRITPNLCPRCKADLDDKVEENEKGLFTTSTCPKCGYMVTDRYEWKHKKEEEIDTNFAKDRDRFCLAEEEGKKYQEEKWRLEGLKKFMGEWEEVEKERAEMLKANPKGFHLEDAYSCAICGQAIPRGDNWYDKWGIKCLVCQKAIDNKEIPPAIAKNKNLWYSKYDLESKFGLKTPTLKKWIRDGLIKPRNISHYGEGVHPQIFLLEDNKGFLPPKKLVESRGVTERKDGKDWFTTAGRCRFGDPYKILKGYKIMDHLRVVPAEEMESRGAEEKQEVGREDGSAGRA